MRTVSAQLQVDIDSPAELAIQVALANPTAFNAVEQISLTLNGAPVPYTELVVETGGRVWLLDAATGHLEIDYRAEFDDAVGTPPVTDAERLVYLRPSRYCESDRMAGLAHRLFRGLAPTELLPAVSSWVGTTLEYVSGSSEPTDGAVDTLLAGRGVCRDYAHLAVCLLRGLDIPARLAAVYAPGLDPMDFHAVAEAFIDGVWYVVDGTLLAPRASLARIATGRDAADTSFLSSYGGLITINHMLVTATVDSMLPTEDVDALISLP